VNCLRNAHNHAQDQPERTPAQNTPKSSGVFVFDGIGVYTGLKWRRVKLAKKNVRSMSLLGTVNILIFAMMGQYKNQLVNDGTFQKSACRRWDFSKINLQTMGL
jgi:hypothetical protein